MSAFGSAPALSAAEEHFLKKELINLELTKEINKLSPTYTDAHGLRRFGPPFRMYDPRRPPAMDRERLEAVANGYVAQFDAEFPLLRFMFTEFLVTFPFIKMHLERLENEHELWDKVQVFWEMWRTKKISNSNDRGELSKRKLAVHKLQSLLLTLFNSAILCRGDEEYFRTSEHRNTYKKMNKLTAGELTLEQREDENYVNGLLINVVGVTVARETKARYFLGSSESKYYNFIIRVRTQDGKEWHVKRRYSQFAEFDKTLGKLFPGTDLPVLPAKTKAKVVLSSAAETEQLAQGADAVDVAELEELFMSALRRTFSEEHDESDNEHEFPREGLRMALRGYLRALVALRPVCESAEFLEFISANRVRLTVEEQHDIEQRRQLEFYTVLQHYKFQQETLRAVTQLETQMEELKEALYSDGFAYIFKQLETKSTSSELSKPLRSLVQLVQIEVASTIYELLVGSDNSRETLGLVKRLHRLFPYGLVATILRFTNPMQIVKKLIDLFTFQMPVGFGRRSRSLLQMIFTGVLNDDLKKCDRELGGLHRAVLRKGEKYAALLHKVDAYFAASDETVLQVKKTAQKSGLGIFPALLLNNNDLSPKLDERVLLEVLDAMRKSKTDRNTVYFLLHSYFKTSLRRLDKIALKELWDEPELIDLIKELLAIFFQPLIRLFKSAQIHLYIPVVQRYMNELIQLAEYFQNEHFAPNVVASFMGLQEKYQEAVYGFMHRLYLRDTEQQEGLFAGFLGWFNRFVSFVRFVRDGHEELVLDLSSLGVDEGVRKELRAILAEIEEKRRKYEQLAQQPPQTTRTQVDANWEKVNSRMLGLAGDVADLDRLGEYVGLSSEDLMELNGELDAEEPADGFFHEMDTAAFLRAVQQVSVSDEEFRKNDETGQYRWSHIAGLEGRFRPQLAAVLAAWRKLESE
ncbi:hypothetical protein KL933_005073 [Ogataea haglerorum]|uniref:PX domain-containing protein n=1 Tax=Ogataea haglerorum TaxID=1937702 RepID=A0AAN6D122_9ASCO|nr:hypothetical protein KL933_005073 [Ogataea haglerorum]KAG7733533.1 hypothetical protein KL932_005133 [Ogataea haglerorum]KAG7736004.1 hypothetical protein KL923_005106 [Ogataea haglerorum]KAG7805031.1 hypothetical protein KL924_005174 [Ogataea haglerorum]